MLKTLALALTLSFSLTALPAAAQTTGVPGVNDLTVNGIASGSTSCGFVLATGLPLNFVVSAAPGVPIALFIDTCPCRAGTLPLPPALCYGMVIPQSIDLGPGAGCIFLNVAGTTNAAGLYSLTLPACSTPFRFSTQAVILDPACTPFLLTQAYQVSC